LGDTSTLGQGNRHAQRPALPVTAGSYAERVFGLIVVLASS